MGDDADSLPEVAADQSPLHGAEVLYPLWGLGWGGYRPTYSYLTGVVPACNCPDRPELSLAKIREL